MVAKLIPRRSLARLPSRRVVVDNRRRGALFCKAFVGFFHFIRLLLTPFSIPLGDDIGAGCAGFAVLIYPTIIVALETPMASVIAKLDK